ncbi:hypothetical protein [Nocardia sp. NPDC052566]|uniref:hypothetical protein n=1 Tax=Nocardia sp. NPDC052566 TaxID=3364330 RepID=UPI0037CB1953
MHIRSAAAAFGIAAVIAMIAAPFGAGQAAAVTPFLVDPASGLYVVELDHSETVALRNSPLPRMLDPLWRGYGSAIIVPDDSAPGIRTDFSTAVNWSADSTDGKIFVGFVPPSIGGPGLAAMGLASQAGS